MAGCDDTRQLTQAEREAAFSQQRTGVVQAVRPFSGAPTLANLIDYVNRELGPAVRASRNKINDCFQQVADNAPSANPLGYYFSSNTANADPTAGRVRLDASPENTATTLRVSESNARLQDVSPWLDMMIGGSTLPLGVVTLMDAINPGRFLRGNLTNITPQTGYRDLAITVFESSHPDPFVDGEAVLVSYVAGMADGGVVVPASVLAPISRDTFLANIGTVTAAPAETPLANVDSASVVYDATSHTFQRAALTGFAAAAQDSNATTSAEPIVTYSASSNMSAERVTTSSTSVAVDTGTANQVLFKRAALTGDVTASADSNATTIANNAVTNAKLANMVTETFKGNISGSTGAPSDVGLATVGSTSVPYDATSHTFQRAALTGELTASVNSNATTVTRGTDFDSNPWSNAHKFQGQLFAGQRFIFGSTIQPTALSADVNDYNPTSWSTSTVVYLSSTTLVHITGAEQGVVEGDFKWLINVGANPIHLSHQSLSSSAANRFACPQAVNCVLLNLSAVGILWDGSGWRPLTGASEP